MSANLYDLGQRQIGLAEKNGVRLSSVVESMAKDHGNIIGRHMNTQSTNLEKATERFNESAANILEASNNLHAQMDGLSKKAKEAVSRAKDQAAQMTDAMNKITKLIGPDFEARLKQLQELTDCLERLSALQEAGKLEAMMKAVGK